MLTLRKNRHIYLIPLLVFALGIALSQLHHRLKSDEQHIALEKHFTLHANNYFSSIENSIKVEIERVNSLAAAFDIRGELSAEEFDDYAQVLTPSKNSIQALGWIPVVKHSERAGFEDELTQRYLDPNEDLSLFDSLQIMQKTYLGVISSPIKEVYFPIKYIYPLKGNSGAVGLDISSVPLENRVLDEARIIKQVVMSAPLQIVQELETQRASLFYRAIFDRENPDQLLGYVGLLLRMGDFFELIKTSHFLNSGLSYSILDISSGIQSQQAFFVNEAVDSSIPKTFYKESFHILTLGHRTWSLGVKGDVRNISGYQSLVVKDNPMLGGLLMSLMVSFLVFGLLLYRRERHLSKAALQTEKNRYETLLEHNSDAFFLTTNGGRIISVNDQSVRLTGYSRVQLLTMNIMDIETTHSKEAWLSIYKSLDFKQRVLISGACLCKAGFEIPIEISSTKFLIDDSRVVIGSFVRDLTDQIRFEALSQDNVALEQALHSYTFELEEQRNAFKTVFEKSTDGIFISSGRHILDCNEATVKEFGYASKAELLKQPNSLFSPKYQPDGEKSHRKGNRMLLACLEKGTHNYEWVNRRASGELFWTDVVLTRLEFKGETRIHVAFRDISNRKKLESDLIKAKDKAETASLAKSEFLANMSHEIRTPLHGILSYSNLGVDRIDTVDKVKLARYFELINISGQRLMMLLNDLLDSAKLETGNMQFDFVLRDVLPIIEQSVSEQASLLDKKNIVLISPKFSQTAYFDVARIRQVFANLISNAIKFSPEDSQIIIDYQKYKDDYLLVSVRDFGGGVQEDALLKIFDKFTQNHPSHQGIPGTGLGLAICKEIVEAHDGAIWVESTGEGGAVFKFTLLLSGPENLSTESVND